MGTLVCFHAHPDDESIATGGTIARAAAAGHRVVLVVATGGEHGERPPDLAPGESLADRRAAETHASAAELGVSRVVFLGYEDSGMTGWEQNANERAFCNADIDEAAALLAAVLREESADTVTVYDWHGGYGHPDHIQVHRVGHRAAHLAGTRHVYESSMNRDSIVRFQEMMRSMGREADFDVNDTDDGNPFGLSESELTTAVDVSAHLERKRASIRCHASQISDTSFFSTMPPEAFAVAFGTEWFRRVGGPPLADDAPAFEDWLAGL